MLSSTARTASHCNILQYTAAHCKTRQLEVWAISTCTPLAESYATHCSSLEHTPTFSTGANATHYITLQHTATHCNTLHRTATHCNTLLLVALMLSSTACILAYCNALQCTATHCNALQHTATHCNTLQHTPASSTHSRSTVRTTTYCTYFRILLHHTSAYSCTVALCYRALRSSRYPSVETRVRENDSRVLQ